jgi:aspartyl-tRNA(Asn)/glutamyl-tRNA(Gln) amidotransferase subunit C
MITQKDVEYISALARIHLSADEVDRMAADLERILEHIAVLEKADTSKVSPTSHVLHLKDVFREDEIKPSLGQKIALKIAVEQRAGSFTVPKVLE